ncbi:MULTISPECIES: hypothetical protein [unclassified Pseudomonas]|uniref:hypothetical protein n=1 Tax=unclassified Pseudomonas TaxID=196821 RepID=UPI0011B02A69|nr:MULTISPECIES: hypothetical protein [unclassified Pseudomonas]
MDVSGDFSRVVDFLSKLAGCSVLFLGFAFCAGYFYSSAYLQAFDSEWFISGFTFVELVARGIWNAVCGAIGLLILLVIVQSPSVSERKLLWLMRCVCYPFYLLFLVAILSEKFGVGGSLLSWVYQSPWARAWVMSTLVCQAANYLHPDSLKHLIFKLFSIIMLFMLAYGAVVELPKMSAREHAETLQSQDRAGMLKAYKEGATDVHFLVDSANGKLLLQKIDKSLMVVDPTNGWRISR